MSEWTQQNWIPSEQDWPAPNPNDRPSVSPAPIIAGILALLCGILYTILWASGPPVLTFMIFMGIKSILFLVGGTLLIRRKKLGIHLTNAGCGSILISLFSVLESLTEGFTFTTFGYLTASLIPLTIAVLIFTNIAPTWNACATRTSKKADTANQTRLVTISYGVLQLALLIYFWPSDNGIPSMIDNALLAIILLIAGGILIGNRKTAGQLLAILGAGTLISTSALDYSADPVQQPSLPTAVIVLTISTLVALAVIAVIARPSVDRAMKARTKPSARPPVVIQLPPDAPEPPR